jgi:predicted DNA-binding ribbon-helix-helix protein
MPSRTKKAHRSARSKAIRQSVTIPAPLATEVRRVAEERHLTMSRALVALAERGVQAELDAKENLQATYRRFMKEQEPALKEEAGKDLIRAVFGKDAIAEDPLF